MVSFSQMPSKHHADATHLLDSGLTSLMRRTTIQMRKHISNKIRSTFPDASLFEETRSKRRRPFTEAEDAALKASYDATTWATHLPRTE